jgi:uncharacterized protein (DUF433 family)
MMNILKIDEIISDSEVRDGRPIIRGTRICVSDVVAWHLSGDKLPLEKIATDFHLGLGQVYSALSYYYLHQDQIDSEMRQSTDDAQRLLKEIKQSDD